MSLIDKLFYYIENTKGSEYEYKREDFVLKDNGDGNIYIDDWKLNIPRPNLEELETLVPNENFKGPKREKTLNELERRIEKLEKILEKNKLSD